MRYWKIVVGGLIVVTLVASIFYFYKLTTPQPRAIEPSGSAPLFTSPVVDGMRIYRSPLLGFQVSYPEDLSVREYGKGNTSTVVFEDSAGQRGFQVFVVPYSESVVSEKRFKMDVPSGVMREPIQVVVDGATATAFWSSASVYGETREVWFIKDGFLYEITTYKDLDAWLGNVMKTWRFLQV